MPNYKILTDSCCDFTDEQYRQLDVSYVPLTVIYDGESHSNFSEETAVLNILVICRVGTMIK